jgi:TolB-like protein/Tfp pilus assembly protein PilF
MGARSRRRVEIEGEEAREEEGEETLIAALLFVAVSGLRTPDSSSWQCPDGSPPPCARAPSRGAAIAPSPTSVAVLYFDNLSRDTNDIYLAEGLTDELITRLGQVERLQVKSRNAVRRFRGDAAEDPAAVGRALGVAHLVSGSVRRTGDRVRVTVELTRAATGAHVWGDVLERTNGDMMSVESEVASAIATAVGGRLAPAERQALAARPTVNAAAYDHALRGDFFLARRTAADDRLAIAEYDAAARLDPSFTRAWARIALAYYLALDWDWRLPGLTRDSIMARGFAASAHALTLDSANADAWAARGLLLAQRNATTMEGVLPALERAVTLDPRNAEAWHQLASVRMVMRRDSAALVAFRRALAIDPQRWISLANMSTVLFYQRRHAEALVLLDSAVAVGPEDYYPRLMRGWVRFWSGDRAGAATDGGDVARLRPADMVDAEPFLAALRMAAGDSAGARAHADSLAASMRDVRSPSYGIAGNVGMVLALVGQREQAMEILERGRASGVNLWWMLHDPGFDSLRGDPRFRRLFAELAPPGESP